MREALTKIYEKKKKTIDMMAKENTKLLAVVYGGLAKNKSIRDIHKEIRKVYQMQPIHDIRMVRYCMKLAKKGKKKVESRTSLLLTGATATAVSLTKKQAMVQSAWEFIHFEGSFTKMTSISYQYAQEQESKEKEELIKEELGEDGPKEDQLENALKLDMVFYLASAHEDCAKDHKDYQGKIYYNRNWRMHIGNNEVKKEIIDYIKKHHLKTFQWVTGRPVWFITRPNCRHYFQKLSVGEVLDTSVDQLIKKYKMNREIGDKRAQTIRHSTKKEWYTKENVTGLIDKYIKRLLFHRAMYEEQPNDDLKHWIEKDEYLIKKWRKYQETLK